MGGTGAELPAGSGSRGVLGSGVPCKWYMVSREKCMKSNKANGKRGKGGGSGVRLGGKAGRGNEAGVPAWAAESLRTMRPGLAKRQAGQYQPRQPVMTPCLIARGLGARRQQATATTTGCRARKGSARGFPLAARPSRVLSPHCPHRPRWS